MEEQITGYCVRCKVKQEMRDAEEVVLKNGRHAKKGKCKVCGTVMFRFIKNK